jgi:hypothetical protein
MNDFFVGFLDRLATGIFTTMLILLYLYARAHVIKNSGDNDELGEPPNSKKIASGKSIQK